MEGKPSLACGRVPRTGSGRGVIDGVSLFVSALVVRGGDAGRRRLRRRDVAHVELRRGGAARPRRLSDVEPGGLHLDGQPRPSQCVATKKKFFFSRSFSFSLAPTVSYCILLEPIGTY